jgi:pimeloyl-ACP methyl ester carboxylesterase
MLAASALAIGTPALHAGSASAQSNEELRNRFREECRAQFPHLRGAAHKEERAAMVSQCIKAKFVDRRRNDVRQAATERVPSNTSFVLNEFHPWLAAPNRGPAEALGMIYFARGFPEPNDREDVQPIPYLLKTLSDEGWDIVAARVPSGLRHPGVEYVAEAASFLRRRTTDLKEQGYRRIILVGHSWGGWAAILAAQAPDFRADVMLLSAPNTFGSRISPVSKGPNPVYGMAITQLPRALKGIKTPTVMMLPDDTEWDPDPAQRGAITAKYFKEANVPGIVIAKPPGFFGHFAAWLPVFDYAYGRCIRAFIDNSTSEACTTPELTNDDFRSIVDIIQVADGESKVIKSAEPLVGRKFVAYTLTSRVARRYDYISPTKRQHVGRGDVQNESVSFAKDLHCAASQCTRLVKWTDREFLEFDAESGKIFGWWIEQR